jgi:hypothetical protein
MLHTVNSNNVTEMHNIGLLQILHYKILKFYLKSDFDRVFSLDSL